MPTLLERLVEGDDVSSADARKPLQWDSSLKPELERRIRIFHRKSKIDDATSILTLSYLRATESIEGENIYFAKDFLKAAFNIITNDKELADDFYSDGNLGKLYRFHIQTIRRLDADVSRNGSARRNRNQNRNESNIYQMMCHLHSYAAKIARQLYDRTPTHSEDRLKWAYNWYRQAHNSGDLDGDPLHKAIVYEDRGQAALAINSELTRNRTNGHPNAGKIKDKDWYSIAQGCFAEALRIATLHYENTKGPSTEAFLQRLETIMLIT
jgi:hypothetical protein